MPYKKKNVNKLTKYVAKTAGVNEKNLEEDSLSDSDSDAVTISSSDGLDEITDLEQELERYVQTVELSLELVTSKGKKQRMEGLTKIMTAVRTGTPCNASIIASNIVTLCDALEKIIKKSDGADEHILAVALIENLALLSLALEDHVSEEVYSVLYPLLLRQTQDPTLAAAVRTACVRAVGVLALFLGPNDPALLGQALNVTYGAFVPALPKGDKSMPALSPALMALHTAALQAFLLLLSSASSRDVGQRRQGLITDLTEVLRHHDLDIRCTAGSGIALLCELLGEEGEHLLPYKQLKMVLEKLDALAKDSHKQRGKKERKEQRHVFRAIVNTVESNGEYLDRVNQLHKHRGDGTDVQIGSWEQQIQYEVVSGVLLQGTSTHFVRNEGLRCHFDVGRVVSLLEHGKAGRLKKASREDEEKRRHLGRNRDRQKRSNIINIRDEEE